MVSRGGEGEATDEVGLPDADREEEKAGKSETTSDDTEEGRAEGTQTNDHPHAISLGWGPNFDAPDPELEALEEIEAIGAVGDENWPKSENFLYLGAPGSEPITDRSLVDKHYDPGPASPTPNDPSSDESDIP